MYAGCEIDASFAFEIKNLALIALTDKIINFLQEKLHIVAARINANDCIKTGNYYGNSIQQLDKPFIQNMIKDKHTITNFAEQWMCVHTFHNTPSKDNHWVLIQLGSIDFKIGSMSRCYAFLADSLFMDKHGKIQSFEITTDNAIEKSLIALQTKSLCSENKSTLSAWIWKFTLKKISLGWSLDQSTRQYIFESTNISLFNIRKIISSFKISIYEEAKLENIFILEILNYLFFINQTGFENKIQNLIAELEIERPDIFKKEPVLINKISINRQPFLTPKPPAINTNNEKARTKRTKNKSKTKKDRKNISYKKTKLIKVNSSQKNTNLFKNIMTISKNNPQLACASILLSLYILKQMYKKFIFNPDTIIRPITTNIPKSSLSIHDKQTLKLALSTVNPSNSIYTTLKRAKEINNLFNKEELKVFNQWHISSVAQWGVFPCTNLPYEDFEFLANHEIPERINRSFESSLQLIHIEDHAFQMLCDTKAIRNKHQIIYKKSNIHIPIEQIFPKDYYEFEAFIFSATHPNPIFARNLALMHHIAITSMIPMDRSFFKITFNEFNKALKILDMVCRNPMIETIAEKYNIPQYKIINNSAKFLELNSQLFLVEDEFNIEDRIIFWPAREELFKIIFEAFKNNNASELCDLFIQKFIFISQQAITNSESYSIEKPITQIASNKIIKTSGRLKITEWDQSIRAWYNFHQKWLKNKNL